MLVISRFAGETIHIGDNIVVEIIKWDRSRVKVGIRAPRDVPIMRGELLPKERADVKEWES